MTITPKKKKRHSLFTNFCVLVGSIVFAVILSELILRILGFSAPHFYTYDDIVGHKLIPGVEGWYRQEGKAYIQVNSNGWRDRERSLAKPSNTTRIAVLGDSYTEARQVTLADTFLAVMEKRLNECKAFGKRQVEVLNFGVSGNGTAQEFLTLQHYVWKYEPDIILLAFFTGNDIRNNSQVLESKKWKPFFVYQDGKFVLDNSFVEDPAYQWKSGILWSIRLPLFRYSRTHQLLSKLKKQYDSRQLQEKNGLSGEEIGLDEEIYTEPDDPDWQEAWRVTEGILLKMHEAIQQKNAKFLIVTLSNSIQVHPDSRLRERFMEQQDIPDLLYPDTRIKSFGEQHGIQVLTLVPAFQRYAEQHKVFLHGFENAAIGFGHWNEKGHSLAGSLIADYFCSQTQ